MNLLILQPTASVTFLDVSDFTLEIVCIISKTAEELHHFVSTSHCSHFSVSFLCVKIGGIPLNQGCQVLEGGLGGAYHQEDIGKSEL